VNIDDLLNASTISCWSADSDVKNASASSKKLYLSTST